jgi:hypothetical protein
MVLDHSLLAPASSDVVLGLEIIMPELSPEENAAMEIGEEDAPYMGLLSQAAAILKLPLKEKLDQVVRAFKEFPEQWDAILSGKDVFNKIDTSPSDDDMPLRAMLVETGCDLGHVGFLITCTKRNFNERKDVNKVWAPELMLVAALQKRFLNECLLNTDKAGVDVFAFGLECAKLFVNSISFRLGRTEKKKKKDNHGAGKKVRSASKKTGSASRKPHDSQ